MRLECNFSCISESDIPDSRIEFLTSSIHTQLIHRKLFKMPIAHSCVPVKDLQRSCEFYAGALKPLGYKKFQEFEGAIGFAAWKPDFWIFSTAADAKRAEGKELEIIPSHVCFDCGSRAEVRRFYDAAM